MKITLPELPDGAIGWDVYAESPRYSTPQDNRSWLTKFKYRSLMWLHGKAEGLWHWCYYTSLKYEPPQSVRIDSEYIKIASTVSEDK